DPGECFVGAGVWHPESEPLRQIRAASAADPKLWQATVSKNALTADWSPGGEKLKRPPKGFDPEHPMIEDLKRKDFIAVAKISQKEVLAPNFLDRFTALCRSVQPFNRFIAKALDLPW